MGEEIEGTHEVCRMISENCILRKLNLAGNCFSDRDVEHLTIALEVNQLLINSLIFIAKMTNDAWHRSLLKIA